MQAALGVSQMTRLEAFVARRHEIADIYDDRLAGLSLDTPKRLQGRYSALHLYVVLLHDPERHRATFEALRDTGIMVNLHYIPVHLQPYYRKMGFTLGDFPNAEAYYARAISLPIFPDLTGVQIDEVADAMHRLLK